MTSKANFSLLATLFFFQVLSSPVHGQDLHPSGASPEMKHWVDSVFASMSYEEKIGQLFMVDAFSNKDRKHVSNIEELITKYHIGGVIFFQGGPVRQAHLTNRYQSLSRIPLMVGIDGEWGLAMRLDSTIRFPRQMTLAAGNNDSLIYEMGKEIARQCKRMGIHLNFAPVADINNNPLNPVINSRSFSENKEEVTRHAVAYMKGMQDHGVLACGKHFPGHGNTDADSHYTLPVVNQSASAIDSMELYPFRKLIQEGVASMMVAHLFIPSLDTTSNRAATLSPSIIDSLLRKTLGFEGLVFTDALNMKGVAEFYPAGDAELLALKAGNDVLLYSTDVAKAWERIHLAIQNCEIEQSLIDEKVIRILKAKYRSGLFQPQQVSVENLYQDLNTPESRYLNRQLYQRSVTLLKNEFQMLPFRNLDNCNMASLVLNDTIGNPFQLRLLDYARMDLHRMPRELTELQMDSLTRKLLNYEYIIVSVHNTTTRASAGYGVSDQMAEMVARLKGKVKLVTVVLGNAYTLSRLPAAFEGNVLVLAYEDTPMSQDITAQMLFGGSATIGRLPVTPLSGVNINDGIRLEASKNRLRFTDPLELGLHPTAFSKVDSIAMRVVTDSAAPGLQVLVAWKGNIIYQKSFGRHTYDPGSPSVTNSDLYDIASVTKTTATALALMKLQEEEEIDIRKKASRYYHALRKTNKKDLLIEDILTHRAGLKPFVPFWKSTLENGKPAFNIYHFEKDVNYSVQVADSMFILKSYIDKVWKEIYDTPLGTFGEYVYSDLGLLLMQRVVENVTKLPLDEYLDTHFYDPLGLTRLTYNPVKRKVPLSKITPTELDTSFRRRLIHGFVHDPTAAMIGGVAGHAGLFSDAYNVAVVMQMLMNGGEYGGFRFLKKESVNLFTERYFKEGANRRGLLFDKPETAAGKSSPTAASASPGTFGHTGFTGTAAWADPEHELVFVFLSNRVHPSASDNKLAKGNYRTDMMEAVYEVLKGR